MTRRHCPRCFSGLPEIRALRCFGGLPCGMPSSSAAEAADAVAAAKLTQSFPQTLLQATLCGVLMYLAVTVRRDRSKVVAILFCVPAFILAGFEHSIADFFYFSAAAEFSGQMWLFTLAAPARQLGRIHASAPAVICRQRQASRVTVIRKEHTGT